MNTLAQFDPTQIKVPSSGGLLDLNDSNLKIGDVISKVLPFVFGAAAITLLIYLVMGGLQMMTSKGDPKIVQGAQTKITNALIGFVIIFFAFAIVSIFGKVFGIGAFGNIFK